MLLFFFSSKFHKSNARFSRYNFRSSNDRHRALYQTHYSKRPVALILREHPGLQNWSLGYDLRYCFVKKNEVSFQALLEVSLSRLGSCSSDFFLMKQFTGCKSTSVYPSPVHPFLNIPLIINSKILTIISIKYWLPLLCHIIS